MCERGGRYHWPDPKVEKSARWFLGPACAFAFFFFPIPYLMFLISYSLDRIVFSADDRSSIQKVPDIGDGKIAFHIIRCCSSAALLPLGFERAVDAVIPQVGDLKKGLR